MEGRHVGQGQSLGIGYSPGDRRAGSWPEVLAGDAHPVDRYQLPDRAQVEGKAVLIVVSTRRGIDGRVEEIKPDGARSGSLGVKGYLSQGSAGAAGQVPVTLVQGGSQGETPVSGGNAQSVVHPETCHPARKVTARHRPRSRGGAVHNVSRAGNTCPRGIHGGVVESHQGISEPKAVGGVTGGSILKIAQQETGHGGGRGAPGCGR